MADFILGRLKFTFLGEWNDATAYIVDDIVVYNGTGWVCKTNHTSTASFPEDRDDGYWEAITTGFNYAGEWDSATTYEINDVVQYSGSTWISVQNSNTNHTPTSGVSTYWDLLLQGDADSVMTTQGDISYRGASAATRLGIGSDGAILQVDGVTSSPIWSRTINNADDIKLIGQIYGGAGAVAAETNLGLTNIQALFNSDTDAFSQFAIRNENDGNNASTDFIAYADNGDNDSGWIDMGITSSTYDDPTYGVTGINDGYIFMSAPDLVTPLGNGNLYISTSGNGLQNDIVFSTGGFEDTTYERMRIVGAAHGSFNAGLNLLDDVSTTNGKFYIGPSAKSLTDDGATASTQLDGGINSTATTITVDSTTGFNTKGYITINDEVIYYGGKTSTTFTNCNRGYQGTTAASHADNDTVEQITYVGLTNPTAVFTGNANDFVQFSIKNTNSGTSASTDLIAYASDGDNDSGWIDLGITSATYNDPAFTVTGPGTGYLFFSAPATTTGTGNLLIGTDHTGSANDIVFFTNGFDAGNERVRIIGTGANAGVEIYADTESTSTTTGALRVEGGVGLIGNMNIGGNITINGTITVSGGGSSVSTTTLTVSDPMIVMGSGNTTTDTVDLGFYGIYGSGGTKHAGLVRDASDSKFKLFTALGTQPTTTVDFTGATLATLSLGTVEATNVDATNFKIAGTTVLSGTTLGTAIVNSSLTSVGTLTSLSSGAITTSGTLAVNAAGGITTDQTTFPLVNTTATTVNFAGAATAVNIGASSGTTTINNALSIKQVQETLNTKTGATGVVTHDWATGAVFYHSSMSANFTVNFTNLPTIADKAYGVTLVLNQGGTGYYPSAVQVNGGAATLRWANNTAPTASTNKVDMVSFTLVYTGSTWYVLGQFTNFA